MISDRGHSSPNRSYVRGLAIRARHKRTAFGQRRKMLRSSLKPLGGEAFCLSTGVDPAARAEDIAVAQYLALAERVE